MERKGQKFNKYTANFRKMIVQEVKNNSISFIAKKYQINKKTIASWYENFKKGILNTNKGPKESFEKRDLNYYKVRYELLKKAPWLLQLNKRKIVCFIKQNLNKYSLKLLLDVAGLKRSYWNKYKNYLSNGKDSKPLKNRLHPV